MSTSYAVHDFEENTEAERDQLNALSNVAGWDRITADVTTDDTEQIALGPIDVDVMDSQIVLVMVAGRVSCDELGAQIIGNLEVDGSTIAQATRFVAAINGDIFPLCFWRLHFPGASGTYTYRFVIHRGGGTGDVNLLAQSDAPSELLVVRIGQA